MDICFLLLVSFLSVFHFSSADQPLEEEVIVARNVELLGGWTLASPEREDVREAAKEAVELFNSKSKAKKYFKLVNVTSASTQVTNKINYKIEATLGKTKCRKSEDTDIEACGMTKRQLACKFEVTLDLMIDEHEVQKMSCRRSA
ncbi:L-cystatin-like [Sinocyclocheilus rhinocerous]|uniref:L-cystatin-like n=1 Tax=Sinocyclocheilus rhinocerous TaxID=307959 RepID=A0A673HTJ9_9TELE|nr:PREDICTED: L-cystatin-like [Sinocyclocheilus rhinocerous]